MKQNETITMLYHFPRTFIPLLGVIALFSPRNLPLIEAFAGFKLQQPQQAAATTDTDVGNVLILDHININHERGRHDLVKAFYFDFLRCAVDPRKGANLESGSGTVWANVGSQQFHLPEGNPSAQVLDGVITLAYPDLRAVRERYETNLDLENALADTEFFLEWGGGGESGGEEREHLELLVTDPWGTSFRLIEDSGNEYADPRGSQPGGRSEGIALTDLTLRAPVGCNFAGIGRFYQDILGAPCLSHDDTSCVVKVGPKQTLTFLASSTRRDGDGDGDRPVCHVDLVENPDDGTVSNYGAHVSMYLADMRGAYERADAVGVTYVNPRFKRRAYDVEEAVDDCMFRCIDVVDPDDVGAGPILKLEHEIRSVVRRDGSKYKSCPFDSIPEVCLTRY